MHYAECSAVQVLEYTTRVSHTRYDTVQGTTVQQYCTGKILSPSGRFGRELPVEQIRTVNQYLPSGRCEEQEQEQEERCGKFQRKTFRTTQYIVQQY